MKRLLLVLFVVACSSEEVHDVKYYMNNPEAMNAKVKECIENVDELAGTPECVSAIEAMAESI